MIVNYVVVKFHGLCASWLRSDFRKVKWIWQMTKTIKIILLGPWITYFCGDPYLLWRRSETFSPSASMCLQTFRLNINNLLAKTLASTLSQRSQYGDRKFGIVVNTKGWASGTKENHLSKCHIAWMRVRGQAWSLFDPSRDHSTANLSKTS